MSETVLVERSETVLAWHWLSDDGCLRHWPHTKVEVGQTLSAEGPLELCENGMHASLRALDALRYAPGAIICRVELSGELVKGDNKLCARHRQVIAMADATKTLHEFACWCAEQALLRERESGREPDPGSWEAIEVKRRWLAGEATVEELRAAGSAAYSAVEHAAGRAAWHAAWSAAECVAWNTATEAARDAAMDAARNVAWNTATMARYAAKYAARDTQNTKLEEMLNNLLEGATSCES